MNSSKVSILQDNRFKVFFAVFVMVGWSLAYPLIKLGYQEFQIDGRNLGGKILFAGVRFFMAGTAVTLYCHFKKIKTDITDQGDIAWLVLLGIVNTALHYMFAYIGLGYNSSARSTILDSMGGFILIILSTIIFPDDKMTWRKAIGCILGVAGIVSINIQPGVDFFENITFMGDGMILLNACCTALGGLITRVVSRRMNITRATGYSMQIGGALLILTAAFVRPQTAWVFTAKGVFILLCLIAISAVCFAIYNALLSYHPISQIAIYNSLIPVLGVIFAALLLHEELKIQYIIAVIMVAIGIHVVNHK
jgi:drug/metabolite transporter (DMT)-like permease